MIVYNLGGAFGCNRRAPHAVLVVEDPMGLATGAVSLRIAANGVEGTSVSLADAALPASATLVEEFAGTVTYWVDALDTHGDSLARGQVEVLFSTDSGTPVTVLLAPPCEGPDFNIATSDGSGDPRCADGQYCANGDEVCVGRVCQPGTAPCPPSTVSCALVSCVEEARSCAVAVDHTQCEPQVEYCDIAFGCITGLPCHTNDDCQDDSICNGAELCISGHCEAGIPPDPDDDSPCTRDACIVGVGPQNFPVADGTTCQDGAGVDEICVSGSCTIRRCGDGFLDALEACDAGADNSDTVADACRNDCRNAWCGDNVLDGPEQCDDGNTTDLDGCLSTCHFNVCGDTLVNPALEQCDDGNGDNDDACLYNCQQNVCGDGFYTPFDGACDDGNTDNTDGCLVGCISNVCGDGYTHIGAEACDDGNEVSGDGCRGDCAKIESCGDNIIDAGEACDDANANPNDGCDQCGLTQWSVSVVTGKGLGGRSPMETPLGNPDGLHSALDGSLIVGDSTGHRIWRLDSTSGSIVSLVGTGQVGLAADHRRAGEAHFAVPGGMARLTDGSLLIADASSGRVRRIDSTASLDTHLGGGSTVFFASPLPAVNAQLVQPLALCTDSMGGVYVADAVTHIVMHVDATGMLTHVAGQRLTPGSAGDGLAATAAGLSAPSALACGTSGDVYIADRDNHRIRKIDSTTGIISTFAGTGSPGATGDGGPAANALLNGPEGIALDDTGALFIADTGNHRVRRVDPGTLDIDNFAGTGMVGGTGDGGDALSAQLSAPTRVMINNADSLFIAERSEPRVRRVDSTGMITTVAGTGSASFERGYATATDPRMWAQGVAIDGPSRVVTDAGGAFYVASSGNHRIFKIADGISELLAGDGTAAFAGDGGAAVDAALCNPSGLIRLANGSLVFADRCNHRIRVIDSAGVITTLAGGGSLDPGDGSPAVDAALNDPAGVAIDATGAIYIAEAGSHRVRKIGGDGSITTLAGNGSPGTGCDDCAAEGSQLSQPTDLTIDAAGNIYVADSGNHRIRRIAIDGTMLTVAGTGVAGFGGDGGAALSALFDTPTSISIESNGSLLVADSGNRRIRRVDFTVDSVSTVAGTSLPGDGVDCTLLQEWEMATDGCLTQPTGVATDSDGGFYIADADVTRDGSNQPLMPFRVRYANSSGLLSTAFGAVDAGGDGGLADGHLVTPTSLAHIAAFDLWLVTGGVDGRVRSVSTQNGRLDTVAGTPSGISTEGALALASRLLKTAGGIAYNAATSTLFVSETAGHIIRAITLSSAAPDSWTMRTFSGTLDAPGHADGLSPAYNRPMGLAVDGVAGVLFVADSGNHVIKRVELATGLTTTIAGDPGRMGFFGDGTQAGLLNGPEAVALASDGSLYIADTGNHRVRHMETDGMLSTVVGDGEPASSGDGSPASYFPVDTPRGLGLDSYGNLFVTSRYTVRVVAAGSDGIARGDDVIRTVYGAEPHTTYPQTATHCLSDVTVAASQDMVLVSDSCQGLLIALTHSRIAP